MKVYLDTCSLQRPLDDQSQLRIRLESEAILAFLALCEEGEIGLISSEALEFEVNRNPHQQRRVFAKEILIQAEEFVAFNNEIIERAKQFEQLGIKGVDALHLACADFVKATYFCSCDDKLIKRAKTIKDFRLRVVTPLELIEEMIE